MLYLSHFLRFVAIRVGVPIIPSRDVKLVKYLVGIGTHFILKFLGIEIKYRQTFNAKIIRQVLT